MALPAILNNSNNLELMWKSESEVFHIIESAITVAALRWPEKLLAQKQRIFRPYNMACRYSSTNDDGGYNSTAYNQEITKEEEEPTKPRRRIIRIKLVKDGKPTTATTVGSGTGATTATTVGRGMGANLKMASDVPWSNSEEYEKKLENSKRKLKEGYSKFEDSRKRSKWWDDALRAYTVKASQASSLHLVLEATLGLLCGFIMFVRVQTREAALLVGILPQVVELLGHQKEAVREKAIMALHRFYQKSPSSVSHLVSNFRKRLFICILLQRLCDNDPGVMGATLCPLFDLISRDVKSFKDLVVSFIITDGNYRAVTNSSMARLSVATFHDPAKTRNISPAPEIVSESSPQRYREVNYGDYMSRWYTKGPEGKRNIDSLLKLTLSSAVDCLD
ncbi:AP-4 complex subunit epsilon [Linum grandiflorum]